MRISDWSSDVCSSDLEERRRRRAEQRRERMIGERRDQYAKDDRQRLSKTRRKQDCEQLRLVADFGERDDGGRGEQGFHDNSGAGRLRDSNRHQTRRPARRSEEHTSELQSLMRISHAVFCLKQKNNKTK